MPDWQEHVQRHLQSLGVSRERQQEIRTELAEHLDDAYQDALRRGLSPEAAMAHAQEQVGNWRMLAGGVRRASREEDDMNDRVRRIWLPGVVVTAVAYGLWTTLLAMGMQPTVVWLRPASFAFFFVPWLLLLPVLGAAAAFWSKRNGGARRDMLAACSIAPLALAAFLLITFVASLFVDAQVAASVKLRQMSMLVVTVVVLPGIALLAGAVPFLRPRARA